MVVYDEDIDWDGDTDVVLVEDIVVAVMVVVEVWWCSTRVLLPLPSDETIVVSVSGSTFPLSVRSTVSANVSTSTASPSSPTTS